MELPVEEAEERRREHWKLFSSLKTTVEGLVSTNNPNVWSRYGGLQRLHKDMNNILSHGLRNEQKDYWPFVSCVRFICPMLAPHVEQVCSNTLPEVNSGISNTSESYKAERWLLHSLQVHKLSAQLRPLLRHLGHMRKFYNDDAFLLSEPHVTAMFQCLEAVEQNDAKLLAQIDTVGPGVCVEAGRAVPNPNETCDSGEGDYDDGPEYLAIGNLGQRNRRDSRSSTPCSDQGELKQPNPMNNLLAPPPPRRSSFSEGQRGPGRGGRGHTRSFSDTGINQKLRNGEYCHNDVQLVTKNSQIYLQHSDTSTPNSLYMESDGPQSRCVSDGMFRKPSEGQSLISYLSEQDFGSCADLEKENAHFSISESLIAAIELMKCNLRRQEEEGEEEVDSDCEIQQLKQKIRLRRQQIRRSRVSPCAPSSHYFHSTDSGTSRRSSQDSYQGLSDSGSAEEVEECELRGKIPKVNQANDFTLHRIILPLSIRLFTSDHSNLIKHNSRKLTEILTFLCFNSSSPSFLQSNSAESVAMGLLRQFEGMQLPAASELDWLVPEHDAPQKLLPIPNSLPISPDDGEHADIYKLRIRVRGNLEWAPPRPQIIFNIHPTRKLVVTKQNYRCAGCGTRIDPDYIKRLRYCEYLGRYFCQCCHENAQAVVPGRVLRKWDFSKYYVSNFARDLLSKIAGDPLFNPNDINSGLYKKVKALETVRVLRVQLLHMKNLFKTCRFAKEVLDQFDPLPGHLTEDLHLFSLNDLTAVRNGELGPRLKELLKLGTKHVAGCVLCQAKGFVCEFCSNDKDIIFPFQLSKCQRCEECHACFHRNCFKPGRGCPRCQRLAERRERMARKNMEEQEDEGGGT
uniref:Rubicon autophagy regulator n=1 Tax=Neogobius melanostomus TaxID=47308 RepID=A0A8C6S5F8_9GOBI